MPRPAKASNARKPRRAPRGGRFRGLFGAGTPLGRRLGLAALGLAAVGVGAAALLAFYMALLIGLTPTMKQLRAGRTERPSVVLARDGSEITQFQRIPRTRVGLSNISPHVVDALIATEDHRFYEHKGLDYRRLVTSTLRTLGGDAQGGSTLTMQLARNLYPDEIGNHNAVDRKLREIVTAAKIERIYTKEEILEEYLNSVAFLYNAYGIERAARTYFDKSAAELTLLESATLVGMLKGTWYYNPVLHPERSQRRRNIVLAQMVKRGKLTEERFLELKSKPLGTDFEQQSARIDRAPHFSAYVKRLVGEWAKKHDYDLYADGLKIHTTLDLDLQRHAQRAVDRQMEALQAVADVEWGRSGLQFISARAGDYKPARSRLDPFGHFWKTRRGLVDEYIRATDRYRGSLEAGADEAELLARLRSNKAFMDSLKAVKTRLEVGLVGVNPQNGQIRLWVGSRNYGRDQYDHVVVAKRQPGSTFKPFVYAAALEKGFSPEDTFMDAAVEIDVPGSDVWRPVNAEGVSNQPYTLRQALAHSKNTVTAQLMDEVGAGRVAALAERMGVRKSPLEAVPSLALGTSSVTLLEMVSAYATIADAGAYREPLAVTRIEDRAGAVLARFTSEAEQALPEATALTLLDMMRGVVDEGTGQRIRSTFGISADVAGKTGTTQENADGWFILMHPDLVAGAWVGFNDQRITFRSDYWGQGAHNALYVVGDTFDRALSSGKIRRSAAFPPPPEPSPSEDDWQDDLEGWFGKIFGRPRDHSPEEDAPEEEPRDERRQRRGQEEAEEAAREMRREAERAAREMQREAERAAREISRDAERAAREAKRDIESDEARRERLRRLEQSIREIEGLKQRARERYEESAREEEPPSRERQNDRERRAEPKKERAEPKKERAEDAPPEETPARDRRRAW